MIVDDKEITRILEAVKTIDENSGEMLKVFKQAEVENARLKDEVAFLRKALLKGECFCGYGKKKGAK